MTISRAGNGTKGAAEAGKSYRVTKAVWKCVDYTIRNFTSIFFFSYWKGTYELFVLKI